VVQAVGQERVSLRVSPWNKHQDVGMKDPIPTFTYLISRVRDAYPNLSYVHAIEHSVHGDYSTTEAADPTANDFIREIWQPKPFISAGNYIRESAMKRADETGELIAFGRSFLSNPDLPLRLEKDIPLTKSDRSTFYAFGSPKGYIDYPFASFEINDDLKAGL